MEFLASLAIKALIGTSVCGTITVGTIYKYDKTLLGFKDNAQTEIKTGGQGGDDSAKSEATAKGKKTEEEKDNTAGRVATDETLVGGGEKPTTDASDSPRTLSTEGEDTTAVAKVGAQDSDSTSTDNVGDSEVEKVNSDTNGVDVTEGSEGEEEPTSGVDATKTADIKDKDEGTEAGEGAAAANPTSGSETPITETNTQ